MTAAIATRLLGDSIPRFPSFSLFTRSAFDACISAQGLNVMRGDCCRGFMYSKMQSRYGAFLLRAHLNRPVLAWLMLASLFLIFASWGPAMTAVGWVGVVCVSFVGFQIYNRQLMIFHPDTKHGPDWWRAEAVPALNYLDPGVPQHVWDAVARALEVTGGKVTRHRYGIDPFYTIQRPRIPELGELGECLFGSHTAFFIAHDTGDARFDRHR